jgi:hypothetical protein
LLGCCFILREQEREHFRAAREQPFLRARARIPRQSTSTDFKARSSAFTGGHTTRIPRSVQSRGSTEIEKREQHLLLAVQYRFTQSVRFSFGTNFEEGTTTVLSPYSTDLHSPYNLFIAQKSRRVAVCNFWKVWHGFLGGRTTINTPRKLLLQLARISR